MKIGEKLYRYPGLGRLFEYVCTAVIQREKATLYEMECQQCSHGYKCRVLVKKRRKENIYEFVCQINEEDGDYQEYWHTSHNKEECYYTTEKDAKISVYKSMVARCKERLEKNERENDSLKKALEEAEAHLANILSSIGE